MGWLELQLPTSWTSLELLKRRSRTNLLLLLLRQLLELRRTNSEQLKKRLRINLLLQQQLPELQRPPTLWTSSWQLQKPSKTNSPLHQQQLQLRLEDCGSCYELFI